MTRFSASLTPSVEDRKIAEHLSRVVKELESAIALARGARDSGYRARRVERDLTRVMMAAQEVGSISSKGGDAESEEMRIQAYREKMEKERLERKRKKDEESKKGAVT